MMLTTSMRAWFCTALLQDVLDVALDAARVGRHGVDELHGPVVRGRPLPRPWRSPCCGGRCRRRLLSELSSTSMSRRVTLYVVTTFSYAAAILSTLVQLSANSRAVVVRAEATKRGDDVAAARPDLGDVGADRSTTRPARWVRCSRAVCRSRRRRSARNAIVRYFAPEALHSAAGLAVAVRLEVGREHVRRQGTSRVVAGFVTGFRPGKCGALADHCGGDGHGQGDRPDQPDTERLRASR